ncbi:MAG: thioredoxin domain-containing protein [candidate division KSB1 bacterium]|nr:thioredoxin domain-containing protein [candidate division KSB1 bacterium]MDZ7364469.1 thioredoxin domain-containing protein [candidate division KSB1 bacterium]MDZ7402841.1 thioredoxin domain-containing protein [candidate division KSB1 bacterium]
MNPSSEYISRQLQEGRRPNRLIEEKSPYLLQHAFNPVDWHPWGEEAFEKARRENKPIFLSIGYSTCHWCHVMERESFENPDIAKLLNEYFVCIKVDREERPDVDKVYMTAVQAMTGSGGWPMSVWLTPNLQPFFAGTYFPPDSRYGRPGFPDLLKRLHAAWMEQREQVLKSAEEIIKALQEHTAIAAAPDSTLLLGPILRTAYSQFYSSYDERLGGFGQAPKFPRPAVFNFLLRYYARTNEKGALDMALATLRKMWAGGMNDHLGGGFHRYSVDAYWRVPHFEKMLYDQAQLVWSYLEAYQITHDDFFANAAHDILNYVLRDLTHPDGGFYSAEDADSAPEAAHPDKKEEGAFYLWRQHEICDLLGTEKAEIFNYCYGVSDTGNTISDPQGEFRDKNVLYAAYTLAEAARRFKRSEAEIKGILDDSKKKLFEVRKTRPRPQLDDKIITAWNGLMISAFARAYQVLDEPEYLQAAERAADFVLKQIYNPQTKTLKRRYRDGEAKYPAHLDDYAFFTMGLLDLYEAAFDIKWVDQAVALTETQNRLFWDKNDGGFYDTSGEDETILLRTKEDYDGAEPSGNSIAVLNLLRLSQMLDRKEWWDMAEKTLRLFAGRLQSIPHAMPQMLTAVDFSLDKPNQIFIAGQPQAPDTRLMLRAVHGRFMPNKILLLMDGGEGQDYFSRFLPFVKSMTSLNQKATVYVCENYTCQLPTTDIPVMVQLLERKKTAEEN